jgi:hypothetical protein
MVPARDLAIGCRLEPRRAAMATKPTESTVGRSAAKGKGDTGKLTLSKETIKDLQMLEKKRQRPNLKTSASLEYSVALSR